MSEHLETLLHLASLIDTKSEKLESALTDSRRAQLANQIDVLTEKFEREYAAFVREQNPDEVGKFV